MSSLKLKLATLHELTADQLISVIQNGVPVRDDNTGEVHMAPAPAAYIAQAIQLLKHNNIQAPLGKNRTTSKLAEALESMPDEAEGGLPFPAS